MLEILQELIVQRGLCDMMNSANAITSVSACSLCFSLNTKFTLFLIRAIFSTTVQDNFAKKKNTKKTGLIKTHQK